MYSTCARMTVEWCVPTGQLRPIALALHALASESRLMPGCLECSVSTEFASQGIIRYVEEWMTEQHLRDRVRADTFNQLVNIIEETPEPPLVEFMLAHTTRGLDFVEEVRSSDDR
jgi:quinol monooxygenase YgiN